MKVKSTLRVWRKSLWCVFGTFAVINDDLQQPQGVYIVLVCLQLVIPTPDINQSSPGRETAPVLPVCQYGLLGPDRACLLRIEL